MISEVTHLQEIVEQLCLLAGDPKQLPESGEQILTDLKAAEGTAWQFQVDTRYIYNNIYIHTYLLCFQLNPET